MEPEGLLIPVGGNREVSAVLAWRGRLRKKTSGCSEVLGCKEVAGPGKGLGEGGVYEGVVIPGGNVCRERWASGAEEVCVAPGWEWAGGYKADRQLDLVLPGDALCLRQLQPGEIELRRPGSAPRLAAAQPLGPRRGRAAVGPGVAASQHAPRLRPQVCGCPTLWWGGGMG